METTQNITLKRLLALTAERQASDMHLVVGNKPTLRIDGDLVAVEEEDVVTEDFVSAVIDTILSEQQKERLSIEKEIIFLYDFVDQNRFRVDVTIQRGMYSLTFHHVPSIVKKLPDLGFPNEIVELTNKQHGLILVGGQQGSGVTTTLAGFVETINQREARTILILSKPLEYSMVSYQSIIQQQEVGVDTPTWLSGLDIAEQDIDVVVVSDIPDGEVLKRLIRLAKNGVLVCAGYQASSVNQLVKSLLLLVDDEERTYQAELFASIFEAALIQALVPKVGGGKVLALEVGLGTASLQRAILEMNFEQINNVIQTSRSDGMITLDRYLAELLKNGLIAQEHARQFARHPETFDT